MAKVKYDGVVEAVRYKSNGEIDWVRLFERRGAVFTDYLIYDRKTLVERIKSGRRYVAGSRVPYLAGTFEVGASVRLTKAGEKEIVVTDEVQANQDKLEGVPVI